MAADARAQPILGWQIAIFAIILVGTLLAEVPSRLLLGVGGLSESDTPFWSTGMLVMRIASFVMRFLFVALPLAFLVRPRDASRKLIVENWYSTLLLAWLGSELIHLVGQLGFSYVQGQIYAACQSKGGLVSDCFSMPLLGIGMALFSVAGFALFFGLLSFFARPSRGEAGLMEGLILGAVTGVIVTALSYGLNIGIMPLLGSEPMRLALLLPLIFAAIEGIALAIAFGIWRQRQAAVASANEAVMRF